MRLLRWFFAELSTFKAKLTLLTFWFSYGYGYPKTVGYKKNLQMRPLNQRLQASKCCFSHCSTIIFHWDTACWKSPKNFEFFLDSSIVARSVFTWLDSLCKKPSNQISQNTIFVGCPTIILGRWFNKFSIYHFNNFK